MLESSLENWTVSSQFFEKAIEINQKYELVWDEGKAHVEMAKMLLAMNRRENEKIAYAKLYLSLDIYNKIGAVKDRELVLGQLDKLS